MSTAGVLQIELMASLARLTDDMKKAERVVGDSTGRMEKSVTSLQNQFNKLGMGLSIGLMIDQARRLVDSYTKVNAQMRIATQTQAEYAKGMEDVRRISTAAQSSIEATTMLYTRLTNSLKQYGASQQDVGRITESVSLGLKAYGATTAEAASAMLQLSQAFGSGRLGGEELRAVSEAMPNMMKILADSMGVPKSALRDLSMQGKITSEVMMKAWNKPEIIAGLTKQANMTRTITGEVSVFRNNMTMLVGSFMDSSKGTQGITAAIRAMSDAVLLLSNHLSQVVSYATTMAILFAGKWLLAKQMAIRVSMAHTEALAIEAAGAKAAAAVIAEAEAAAELARKIKRQAQIEATLASEASIVADIAAAKTTEARAAAELKLAGVLAIKDKAMIEAIALDKAYTLEQAAATAATEARAAATLTTFGKLSQGLMSMVGGKFGIIGLAIWGAYELADYMGWIDKLFMGAEERIKKLRGDITGSREIPSQVRGDSGIAAGFNAVPGIATEAAAEYAKSIGDVSKDFGNFIKDGSFIFNKDFLNKEQEKAAKIKELYSILHSELDRLAAMKNLSVAERNAAEIQLWKTYAEKRAEINKKDEHENRMTNLRIEMEAKLESETNTLTNVERVTKEFLKIQEGNRKATIKEIAEYERAQKAAVLEDDKNLYAEKLKLQEREQAAVLEYDKNLYAEKLKLQKEEQDAYMKLYSDKIEATAAANKKLVDEENAKWKNVSNGMESTFERGFKSVLNGSKNIWIAMRDSFKSVFIDAIYEMVAKKYVVQIVASITGGMASGIASGAAGGIAGGIAGGAVGAGGVVALAGGGTAALGSAAAISQYGMAGMEGSTPIMAGQAAATMSPALIAGAAVVGGLLLAKYGFGWGNSREYSAQRMEGRVGIGGVDGRLARDWTESGGWFGADGSGTDYSEMSKALKNRLKYTADQAAQVFIEYGKAVGDASIATKYWNADVNDIANGIGTQLVPALEEFRMEGETLIDTAKRMTSAIAQTNAFMQSLQASAIEQFKAAITAKNAMFDVAKSIREFASSLRPQGTAGLAENFFGVNALAAGGDIGAQGKLQASATSYLGSAMASARSSLEYSRALGTVQGALEETAGIIEGRATIAEQQLTEIQKSNAFLAGIDVKTGLTASNVSDLASVMIALTKATEVTANISALTSAVGAAKFDASKVTQTMGAGGEIISSIPTSRYETTTATTLAGQTAISTQYNQALAARDANIAAKAAAYVAVQEMARQFAYATNTFSPQTYGALLNAAITHTLNTEHPLAQLYAKYESLPAFAAGSNYIPNDMVAQLHQGEEVKPRAYVDNDREAREETNRILADMRKEISAIKMTNYKMWQIEDKHDIEGMPEVRTV